MAVLVDDPTATVDDAGVFVNGADTPPVSRKWTVPDESRSVTVTVERRIVTVGQEQ